MQRETSELKMENTTISYDAMTRKERKEYRRLKRLHRQEKRKRDGDIGDIISGQAGVGENEKVGDLKRAKVNVTVDGKKIKKLNKLPPLPAEYKQMYRPRHPSLTSNFYSSSEMVQNDLLMKYQNDLHTFEENAKIKKQWLSDVLKEERKFPYSDRSKASLERELEFRGLETSGGKSAMIKVLMMHDANPNDPSLITIGMKTLEKITDVKLFSEHQKPVIGYGSPQLIGLPHDLISKILKYFDVTRPHDYFSLFSLLMSCKFLHEDVLKYFKIESKVFGSGGTPLALSCYHKCTWFKIEVKRRMIDKRLGKPKFNYVTAKRLTVSYIRNKFGLSKWRDSGITFDNYILLEKASTGDSRMFHGIRLCILIYGTLEGFVAHCAKKRQLKINRENNRCDVLEGAYKRAEALNNGLKQMGYPELIECEGQGIKTKCKQLNDHVWKIFYNMRRHKFRRTCFDHIYAYARDYVLTEKPSMLKTVLSKFPNGFCQLIQKYESSLNTKFGEDVRMSNFIAYLLDFFIPDYGNEITLFGKKLPKKVTDSYLEYLLSLNFDLIVSDSGKKIGAFFFGIGYDDSPQLLMEERFYIIFHEDLNIMPAVKLISDPTRMFNLTTVSQQLDIKAGDKITISDKTNPLTSRIVIGQIKRE